MSFSRSAPLLMNYNLFYGSYIFNLFNESFPVPPLGSNHHFPMSVINFNYMTFFTYKLHKIPLKSPLTKRGSKLTIQATNHHIPSGSSKVKSVSCMKIRDTDSDSICC